MFTTRSVSIIVIISFHCETVNSISLVLFISTGLWIILQNTSGYPHSKQIFQFPSPFLAQNTMFAIEFMGSREMLETEYKLPMHHLPQNESVHCSVWL